MKKETLIMQIGDFKMHLDPLKRGISGALWGQGYREPCFMWIIKKEATEGIGVDMGANLGYVTLPLCQQLDYVIAIEPDQRSIKLLKKNIKENNFLEKTKICKFAISNRVGQETIYLAKKNPNLNTFCSNERLKKKKDLMGTKIVKTRTLDSLNILPNFVKIDIEGYEVEAIWGGLETLRRSEKCKLLIEVHPQFYDEKRDFSKVLYELFNIGFNVKYIVSAGCECPNIFKQKGYTPFKSMKDGLRKRGIFKNVSKEDAVDFCSFTHIVSAQNNNKTKVARSILLVK